MADDFRQNVQRERAVTDSILREPVRAPFDLLDEAIRSVPGMIEGRRAEEADADLRRELQEMQQSFTARVRSAELTAEQIAEERTYLQGRIDAAGETLANIDREAFPEEWEELNAVRQGLEETLGMYPVGLTAEDIDTGRQAGDAAAARAALRDVRSSEVDAQAGMIARQREEAREDEREERAQGYLLERDAFQQKYQVELTELNQTWQSIENRLGRESQEAQQEKELALREWSRGLDQEDMQWAEQYRGELQRDLQSNQFDHEARMFDLTSDLQLEIQRLGQVFEGDQNQMDRQLSVDLLDRQINSAEEVAALDRAIRQYEAENSVRLADGHLAIAERKIEFEEFNSARDTYMAVLDDYTGMMDNAESAEAVRDILLSAESLFGRDASQYQELLVHSQRLGSAWAGMRLESAQTELEGNRLINTGREIANNLNREMVTSQQMANHEAQFNNSRLRRDAAVEDVEDAIMFVSNAVDKGDLVSLDMMAARIESSPELQALFEGIDLGHWREEAKNISDFNRSSFEWALTERDHILERHEQSMATGDVDLAQARNQTAADLAASAPRNPEALEAWLNGLRNNPAFESLGGESFIEQVATEIEHNDFLETRDQRERAASVYLSNPQATPEWAEGAASMLMDVYGMTGAEAATTAGWMQEEGWYAGQHRALDLGLKLNEFAVSEQDIAAGELPPAPSPIETSTMLSMINAAFDKATKAAAEQYQGCAVSSDPLSAQQLGLSCSDDQRRSYNGMMTEAALQHNMLLTSLARGETIDGFAMLSGFAEGTASEGAGGVGGDVWRESISPEREVALAGEFEGFYPYPTVENAPEGESAGQLEARRRMWGVALEDYILAVAVGASFVGSNPGTGERFNLSAEETAAAQARILDDTDVAWRDDPERSPGELFLNWFFGRGSWSESQASLIVPRAEPSALEQRLMDIVLGGSAAARDAALGIAGQGLGDEPLPPSGPLNAPGGEGGGGGASGGRGDVPRNIASAMGQLRESGLELRDPREALGDDYAAAAARSPTIRHNNPGALMFAGQAGAVGAREHAGDDSVRNWAHFETMEDGFQAMLNQQVLYAENRSAATRGLGRSPTIEEMIDIYAPPNENSGPSRRNYVNRIVQRLADIGVPVAPGTPLKEVTDNPAALMELGLAMASFEMGENFSRVFVPGRAMADASPRVPSNLFPPENN